MKTISFIFIGGGIGGVIISLYYIPNQVQWVSGLAQNLLIGIMLMIFTPFFTKYLMEVKGTERWKIIHKSARELLNEELWQLLIDFSNICKFDHSLSYDHEVTFEENINDFHKSLMNQVEGFSKNKNISINPRNTNHLLKGDYGKIFERRAENIDSFLTKYMNYLEASTIMYLTNIQKYLFNIDRSINNWNKYKNGGWIRLETESDVLERLNMNMQEIIDNLYLLLKEKTLKL